MKQYSRFIPIIIIWLCLSSCGKDFLNQIPPTSRLTDNVYITQNDFNNATIGAYAALKLPGVYGTCGTSSGVLNAGEVSSDNSDYGGTRSAATNYIWNLKDFNYTLSNTLFVAIWDDHYKGIARNNIILTRLPKADFTASAKVRIEAENRFLRAYFYFNLVRLFGEVPLVTTELTDPYAASNLKRNAVPEVYAQIISDLTFAEANLPQTLASTEIGRATSWCAKALLGKVYLTQKDYGKAASKLAEIVNSGNFSIPANSYAAIFQPGTPAAALAKEVLFAVQYKSGQIGQGSSIATATLPWNISTALFGLTGGGVGDGFMRPTADLDNAYESGDLRKQVSFATSYVNGASTVNERYVTKYRQPGSLINDADIDFPVLRYGDVILMYAEALNENGATDQALSYLNLTRARAGLTAKTGLAQSDARLAIENERRFELAFEGHRWFDLLRTGRYLPVMTAKSYAVKDFNKLFPVPQRERDLDPQLTQNPGY